MKLEKQKIFKVVGEFALIVFGILLALQVDNWNDERKEDKFARETFLEIKSSLKADLIHVQSRIKRLKNISNDLEQLSRLASATPKEQIDVSEQFNSLASYIVLELNTSSYETLKITGLTVIKNSELRFKLVNLYDFYYPRINWMLEKEFNKPNENDYWPIYNRHADYRNKSKEENFYMPTVKNNETFLTDVKVRNAVRQKFNKSQSMIERFERLESNISELITLLESEAE